jgi:hypothetical protein
VQRRTSGRLRRKIEGKKKNWPGRKKEGKKLGADESGDLFFAKKCKKIFKMMI